MASRGPMRHVGTQLRVGVDGNPRPHVAGHLRGALRPLNVLLLRVDELPNLVALQAPAAEPAKRLILVGGADRAEIRDQLQDGRFGDVSPAGRREDAVALNQGGDDRAMLVG